MRALRRGRQETEDQFPQDVQEILHYFKEPQPGQRIVATRDRERMYLCGY